MVVCFIGTEEIEEPSLRTSINHCGHAEWTTIGNGRWGLEYCIFGITFFSNVYNYFAYDKTDSKIIKRFHL